MSYSRLKGNVEKLHRAYSRGSKRSPTGTGNFRRVWLEADNSGAGGGGGNGGGGGGGNWTGSVTGGFGAVPHRNNTCTREILQGFGWTLLNSEKLWDPDRGDYMNDLVNTQTATMCEGYGVVLAKYLLRVLEYLDENWILEQLETEEGTVAVVAAVETYYLAQQDSEAQANQHRGNTE